MTDRADLIRRLEAGEEEEDQLLLEVADFLSKPYRIRKNIATNLCDTYFDSTFPMLPKGWVIGSLHTYTDGSASIIIQTVDQNLRTSPRVTAPTIALALAAAILKVEG